MARHKAHLWIGGLLLAPLAAAQLPPVKIILVGDSTVAIHNGWGPGFCADVTPEVKCINMAKNGRSTSSYRAEGSWAQVLDELKNSQGAAATYVFIQFGHNDQPPKASATDLATEFPANLRRYIREVRSAGGKPVLITSLARRSFKNGRVKDDLEPWADATKKVAAEEHVPVLDLHAESLAAVQKMGPVEANTLAMAPPPPEVAASAASGNSADAPKNDAFDYTHLGEKGSAYFGRMVANELAKTVPELRPYIKSYIQP